MIPVVPAIIPRSQKHLESTLSELTFSPEIHVDVVDGKFVPFTSWPYEPLGVPKDVKNITDQFTLEVDLMVDDPLKSAEEWIEAGADMLVFHTESISLADFKNFVKSAPVSVGISSLNDTPIDNLLPYIEVADYVQLMGIAKIGAQGQSFDDRVLYRIDLIKKRFPKHSITVDGSVNKDTVSIIKRAGTNRLIVGSALVLAEDPFQVYKDLSAII
jgi:ribulose-phosphate 3-epimerase